MKRRLKVMSGPDGKPIAFFPSDVIMVGPVSLPGKKTGIKDEKGNEVPPKPEYRDDLAAIGNERLQSPLVVKGTVKEVAEVINQALKWAEEGE